DTAFTLYDTYGFTPGLTADLRRERNVQVDTPGFHAAMERQRAQARAAGKLKIAAGPTYEGGKTGLHGYEHLSYQAKVVALYADGTSVQSLEPGQKNAVVVLDSTPFYAESGGQHGDAGLLTSENATFAVVDTQKIQSDVSGHHGEVQQGVLKVGDTVQAQVDAVRRARTVRNHSATHLMHKALRPVLGALVQHRGSMGCSTDASL